MTSPLGPFQSPLDTTLNFQTAIKKPSSTDLTNPPVILAHPDGKNCRKGASTSPVQGPTCIPGILPQKVSGGIKTASSEGGTTVPIPGHKINPPLYLEALNDFREIKQEDKSEELKSFFRDLLEGKYKGLGDEQKGKLIVFSYQLLNPRMGVSTNDSNLTSDAFDLLIKDQSLNDIESLERMIKACQSSIDEKKNYNSILLENCAEALKILEKSKQSKGVIENKFELEKNSNPENRIDIGSKKYDCIVAMGLLTKLIKKDGDEGEAGGKNFIQAILTGNYKDLSPAEKGNLIVVLYSRLEGEDGADDLFNEIILKLSPEEIKFMENAVQLFNNSLEKNFLSSEIKNKTLAAITNQIEKNESTGLSVGLQEYLQNGKKKSKEDLQETKKHLKKAETDLKKLTKSDKNALEKETEIKFLTSRINALKIKVHSMEPKKVPVPSFKQGVVTGFNPGDGVPLEIIKVEKKPENINGDPSLGEPQKTGPAVENNISESKPINIQEIKNSVQEWEKQNSSKPQLGFKSIGKAMFKALKKELFPEAAHLKELDKKKKQYTKLLKIFTPLIGNCTRREYDELKEEINVLKKNCVNKECQEVIGKECKFQKLAYNFKVASVIKNEDLKGKYINSALEREFLDVEGCIQLLESAEKTDRSVFGFSKENVLQEYICFLKKQKYQISTDTYNNVSSLMENYLPGWSKEENNSCFEVLVLNRSKNKENELKELKEKLGEEAFKKYASIGELKKGDPEEKRTALVKEFSDTGKNFIDSGEFVLKVLNMEEPKEEPKKGQYSVLIKMCKKAGFADLEGLKEGMCKVLEGEKELEELVLNLDKSKNSDAVVAKSGEVIDGIKKIAIFNKLIAKNKDVASLFNDHNETGKISWLGHLLTFAQRAMRYGMVLTVYDELSVKMGENQIGFKLKIGEQVKKMNEEVKKNEFQHLLAENKGGKDICAELDIKTLEECMTISGMSEDELKKKFKVKTTEELNNLLGLSSNPTEGTTTID